MAGCPVFAKIVPFLAKFGPIFEFLSRFWPVLSRFWIRQTPDFTLPHTKSKLQMLYSYNYLIFRLFSKLQQNIPNFMKTSRFVPFFVPFLKSKLGHPGTHKKSNHIMASNPFCYWQGVPFLGRNFALFRDT